jgi:hypothetical protein
MTELQELLLDLQSPSVWWELGALALCLLLAWGVSAILGRGARKQSVLFGRRLVDGLLFPALLWLLAYGCKLFLLKSQHVPVLKVVLPILASLVVIRLIARVLCAPPRRWPVWSSAASPGWPGAWRCCGSPAGVVPWSKSSKRCT